MSLRSSQKRRPFKTERHTCEANLPINDFSAQKHQLRKAYQISVVLSAVLLSVLYSRYTADFTCDSSTAITAFRTQSQPSRTSALGRILTFAALSHFRKHCARLLLCETLRFCPSVALSLFFHLACARREYCARCGMS